MSWFKKHKNEKKVYKEKVKIMKDKNCYMCGINLKKNEIKRAPDKNQTILCENCYYKALNIIANGGVIPSYKEKRDSITQKSSVTDSSMSYTPHYSKSNTSANYSSDYTNLSDREVSKKKFNAYLNPGTDEAEFRRGSTRKRYGKNDKTGYEKGRDRVKRILDKDDDK